MYRNNETETSYLYLSRIFSKIRGSICLLGGWAIFQTVNEKFSEANGRDYMHSRDIDIGFHIDKYWSDDQLNKSDFAIMRNDLLCQGFQQLSYRLVKYFNINTNEELTEQQTKNWKSDQIFGIYIDPIVDVIHPRTYTILGFYPIDEPLLNQVFEKKKYTICNSLNGKPMLPTPEVLLATKLNTVLTRGESDKQIKDIADIYALLWYSDTYLSELKKKLFSIMNPRNVSNVVSQLSQSHYSKTSKILDISAEEVSAIFNQLII